MKKIFTKVQSAMLARQSDEVGAAMVEYGLLWFLWWRALGYGNPLVPAAIAVGYAITDELHQTTVEGRHGSPLDVLIDSAGIALAYALARRVRSGSVRA